MQFWPPKIIKNGCQGTASGLIVGLVYLYILSFYSVFMTVMKSPEVAANKHLANLCLGSKYQ